MSTERDGQRMRVICDNIDDGEHCPQATAWTNDRRAIGPARVAAGIHRVDRAHGKIDLCRAHALEGGQVPRLVVEVP